ncbi:hypothetical protein ACWGQ5_50455 [Streptomyces sp. NPDC055722]
MSPLQIWFDRKGEPIDSTPAEHVLRDTAYVRVARTRITSATDPGIVRMVSTIWLAADRNFGEDGPPVIFETIVFGCERLTCRYSTEEQAFAGHRELVTLVRADVPDEVVTELEVSDAREPSFARLSDLAMWHDHQAAPFKLFRSRAAYRAHKDAAALYARMPGTGPPATRNG